MASTPAADDPSASVRTERISLERAGRRGWQILGVALAVAAVAYLVATLRVVVVAMLLGVLITATVAPLVDRLSSWRLGRGSASLAVTAGWILVVLGLFSLVGWQFVDEVPTLVAELDTALADVSQQFPGLPIPQDASLADLSAGLGGGGDGDESAATSGLRVGVEVISSILLAMVLSFFFLRDGRGMWRWFITLWDPQRRDRVDAMGRAGYSTITQYVRGLSVVAAADAVLAGVGLFLLGVPLALALAVLTFMAAFIPSLGALVVGAMATALAFTAGGVTKALIVVVLYTVVQQVDSSVLQPWIMGHRLPLHPAMVLVALVTGGVVAGVVGALMGVPVAAALVAAGHVYLTDDGAVPTTADA